MGSADLMPRNLDRRVEVLFPIEDPGLNRYIREELLDTYLNDSVRARLMLPDGTYVRMQTGIEEDASAIDCQDVFLARVAESWSER